MGEFCKICGCQLYRKKGTYARPNVSGRSHATNHHYVAERFFGRTANRPRKKTKAILSPSSSLRAHEERHYLLCYECHEELIHNPVLLPEDVDRFAELVRRHGLSEKKKAEKRDKIAGRIELLQKVIARGLESLLSEKSNSKVD